jgi:hypothetical protein
MSRKYVSPHDDFRSQMQKIVDKDTHTHTHETLAVVDVMALRAAAAAARPATLSCSAGGL